MVHAAVRDHMTIGYRAPLYPRLHQEATETFGLRRPEGRLDVSSILRPQRLLAALRRHQREPAAHARARVRRPQLAPRHRLPRLVRVPRPVRRREPPRRGALQGRHRPSVFVPLRVRLARRRAGVAPGWVERTRTGLLRPSLARGAPGKHCIRFRTKRV